MEANAAIQQLSLENRELKIRLESLGITAATSDTSILDQRLLDAISQIRSEREKSERVRKTLSGIDRILPNPSPLKLAEDSPDEQIKVYRKKVQELEGQIRSASQKIKKALATQPTPLTPNDSLRCLHFEPELSLAIINAGEQDEVQVGMPFVILRDDQEIARMKAIDVRRRITGCLVESLTAENLQITETDLIRVDSR